MNIFAYGGHRLRGRNIPEGAHGRRQAFVEAVTEARNPFGVERIDIHLVDRRRPADLVGLGNRAAECCMDAAAARQDQRVCAHDRGAGVAGRRRYIFLFIICFQGHRFRSGNYGTGICINALVDSLLHNGVNRLPEGWVGQQRVDRRLLCVRIHTVMRRIDRIGHRHSPSFI